MDDSVALKPLEYFGHSLKSLYRTNPDNAGCHFTYYPLDECDRPELCTFIRSGRKSDEVELKGRAVGEGGEQWKPGRFMILIWQISSQP